MMQCPSLPKMLCEQEIACLENELQQFRSGALRISARDRSEVVWADETHVWLRRTQERLETLRTISSAF